MTREHLLTLAGIVLAALGSGLAACGVVLQMNGYYGFSRNEFLIHLARMTATVKLGAVKGEDRVTTMLGLY